MLLLLFSSLAQTKPWKHWWWCHLQFCYKPHPPPPQKPNSTRTPPYIRCAQTTPTTTPPAACSSPTLLASSNHYPARPHPMATSSTPPQTTTPSTASRSAVDTCLPQIAPTALNTRSPKYSSNARGASRPSSASTGASRATPPSASFPRSAPMILKILYNVNNASDQKLLSGQVGRLLNGLVTNASSDSSRFAEGEINYTADAGKLYGLVQCTRDLSGSDCLSCLIQSIGDLASCCSGKMGARVFSASCYLRYESAPFYSVLSPPPPPPLVGASPLPGAEPHHINSKKSSI
ncbi:Cysteine-rich repeat secretory protein 38 [Acorus calamus]|uniref:Cysteine-rich repeat secretory protein 38 n=1 Tax=Acorus calamus TaxID=4465 RepID=A0AAV9DDQ3_ACOCL|nr:Cysteine-rich repeat secretory protein 38 [Acorus calamus]